MGAQEAGKIGAVKRARALLDDDLLARQRETQMLAVLSPGETAELERILRKLTTREDGWDVPY